MADTDRNASSLVRMGKVIRSLRMIRFLRLLRVVKAAKLAEKLEEQISSEGILICLTVFKLLFLLLLSTHLISCVWWLIGKNPPEGETSWILANGFDGEDLAYKYLTSAHWTLTQFT